jgi:hypothetical protein
LAIGNSDSDFVSDLPPAWLFLKRGIPKSDGNSFAGLLAQRIIRLIGRGNR